MRRIRPRVQAVVIGATLTALLTGAVSPVAARPTARPAYAAANVLIEPLAYKTLWPGSLDPSLNQSIEDVDFVAKIYAGLVKQAYDHATRRFKIVPDLTAGMPVISKDGLTYTFKIRPDARFSDGTAVTAQDFVWSFRRVIDPKAQSGVLSR